MSPLLSIMFWLDEEEEEGVPGVELIPITFSSSLLLLPPAPPGLVRLVNNKAVMRSFDRQTDRQTDRKTDIETDRQTDIHRNRQTDRQADRQRNRNRQTV